MSNLSNEKQRVNLFQESRGKVNYIQAMEGDRLLINWNCTERQNNDAPVEVKG